MSWDGLVVVCGGTPWNGMAATEKEIATRLVRRAPVLYVDPPVSLVRVRDASARGGRLRVLDDGLAHLSPVVQPGVDRWGMARLTEQMIQLQLRRATRKLGGDVQAVIVANQRNLFGACGERLSVVYATDDFVAGADLFGVRKEVLAAQQRRQARRADLAVCVSDTIAANWSKLGVETMVLPNGCDVDAGQAVDEAAPVAGLHLDPPVAGFLGNLSDRIDVRLLEAVVERGISLLVVGPLRDGHRFEALLARDRVTWAGEQPPSTMASYLAMIDVGLTPYANTAFNRASFPLKTLEYLAAGRAVVSTDLPATRWLDTDLIAIAREPDAFADAVAAAAEVPRTDEMVAKRRAFAATHSWDARADELAPRLGL
jgi:teichuronic acid biosynthesis glycosyltransferase TuaH